MGLTVHGLRPALILLLLGLCVHASAGEAYAGDADDAALSRAGAFPQGAGPLRVRNVNPIVQLYGMPRPVGAEVLRPGATEVTFNLEIANNFQSDDRLDTFVFLDGETYVASHRIRGAFNDRWEWGFEIPYIAHTGGALDNLVDEFHEVFGLSDGGRSLAPRGRLDYLVRADGVVYADFSDSVQSLGDVRGFVGYQVFKQPRQKLALRSQIKFPTGKLEDLSGSEGTDVSLWAEYQYDVFSSWLDFTVTLSGGISYLGEGELIPQEQVSWLGFGHLGVQIPLHPRIEFHAQLDAHTDVLDTGNPLIAEAGVLGTLGGRIGITQKLWLDLAVIEDLDNKSASDVVFQILLGARF